jgi:outer membrane lipoprotein SlyB
VQYVRLIEQPGQGTGMGAVIGGVAGGVLGNQVGKGRGNDAATVIGAVGGAVAGHQIEKSQRRSTVYEVQVRLDDGSMRTITSPQAWHQGDRVRLYNGGLVSQY